LVLLTEELSIIVGVGFTVIVKLVEAPKQFTDPSTKVGVTVIVATIGESVEFIAVKLGIVLDDPEADKPILGVSLVQLYVVVPVLDDVKVTTVDASPGQITWFAIASTCPNGFTVISTLTDVPGHSPI
jgi:hypothetical protein